MSDQKIADLVKSGNMSEEALKEMGGGEESLVSCANISNWTACYSSATGQLSVFADVAAANSGDTITGVGLTAYIAGTSTSLCVCYTNGFSGTPVYPSMGTSLWTPPSGAQVTITAYGMTQNCGFFFASQTVAVSSC
jgi:hypothetical protein